MRSLLDVNVLVALLDADHSLHRSAMSWFADNAGHGWASCPITQNGCVRVMSHAGYPNAPGLQLIAARLGEAVASDVHEFWADDLSLLDARLFDRSRIHGPRQITDCYLLALAVRHHGRLVTFDAGVSLAAVRGAQVHNLLRL